MGDFTGGGSCWGPAVGDGFDSHPVRERLSPSKPIRVKRVIIHTFFDCDIFRTILVNNQ